MKIASVHALEILDSRGNPTVEATTVLADGSSGSASVPSGASTGTHETVELRDHDPKRFSGNGVLTAVANVNGEIGNTVKGMDAENQDKIDERMIELDGTVNKSRLGANAILSVSLSVARAQAAAEKKPLYRYLSKFNPDFRDIFTMPIPQMNIMNGGKHADWATDIQEFMILPVGAMSITDAVRMGAEVYMRLRELLKKNGYPITVGDEGGFAPRNLENNEEPFKLIHKAINEAGYQAGKDIFLGVDAAASEFYQDGSYELKKEGKKMTGEELLKFYLRLREKYPIISMEDMFDEDDWKGFQSLTSRAGGTFQVVGDDLYVTNVKRLEKGISEKATNAILIKLNQIGTLTETVKAILLARKNRMKAVISHRSGETEDSFIADFVVAMGTGQIKAGAPARSERLAKYNRLLKIEKEVGEHSAYAQMNFP